MQHVEAVIRLFDPNFNVRRIAVRRRYKGNAWFRRGTIFSPRAGGSQECSGAAHGARNNVADANCARWTKNQSQGAAEPYSKRPNLSTQSRWKNGATPRGRDTRTMDHPVKVYVHMPSWPKLCRLHSSSCHAGVIAVRISSAGIRCCFGSATGLIAFSSKGSPTNF